MILLTRLPRCNIPIVVLELFKLPALPEKQLKKVEDMPEQSWKWGSIALKWKNLLLAHTCREVPSACMFVSLDPGLFQFSLGRDTSCLLTEFIDINKLTYLIFLFSFSKCTSNNFNF